MTACGASWVIKTRIGERHVKFRNPITPHTVGGVREFGGCFSSCVSLAAAPLEGIRQPVSFWGCALSRGAIVAIFQRLAVVSSNPSLDISENWGTRDLSADDLAIATANGWTVLY